MRVVCVSVRLQHGGSLVNTFLVRSGLKGKVVWGRLYSRYSLRGGQWASDQKGKLDFGHRGIGYEHHAVAACKVSLIPGLSV